MVLKTFDTEIALLRSVVVIWIICSPYDAIQAETYTRITLSALYTSMPNDDTVAGQYPAKSQ